MAHFAEIDEHNIVKRVLVVHDDNALSGHDFLSKELGLGGTWIQTSYNTRGNKHYVQVPFVKDGILIGNSLSADGLLGLRGNYAGVGFVYDPVNDVFYEPQPYPSWTISLSTNWVWTAPVPYPTDGKYYTWDESIKNWVVSSFW